MKSKSQKYEEAITRNVRTYFAKDARRGYSLERKKREIGIKHEDTRFDDWLNAA